MWALEWLSVLLHNYIEMWAKIIYSVKSEIYQDAGEIVIFSKPLASSSGMFTSLVEIQASIKESEQIWRMQIYRQSLTYLLQEQLKNKVIKKTKLS